MPPFRHRRGSPGPPVIGSPAAERIASEGGEVFCADLDRTGIDEVVAGAIAMLASEDGAHINGEYVRVDGGTLA